MSVHSLALVLVSDPNFLLTTIINLQQMNISLSEACDKSHRFSQVCNFCSRGSPKRYLRCIKNLSGMFFSRLRRLPPLSAVRHYHYKAIRYVQYISSHLTACQRAASADDSQSISLLVTTIQTDSIATLWSVVNYSAQQQRQAYKCVTTKQFVQNCLLHSRPVPGRVKLSLDRP